MDLLVNALKEVSSTDYSVILVLPNEADRYLNTDKDEGNGSDTDRGALNSKYTFDSLLLVIAIGLHMRHVWR